MAHTSSLSFSVGAPWEIFRSQSNITNGRIVDLYTKSGSVGQYNSLLILLPDYGVTISILTAGTGGDVVSIAADMVVQAFLPVLEQVSKDQDCRRVCGTYSSSQDSKSNSTLVLEEDEGPGLVIRKWTNNGVDILSAAQQYSNASGGGLLKSIRLYATNRVSNRTEPGSGSFRVIAYRAVFETIPTTSRGQRIFDPEIGTWQKVDTLMYGNIASDDFEIHFDSNGFATAVEPRVLRKMFVRQLKD